MSGDLVVLTGASGFIGRQLATRLEQTPAEVLALSQSRAWWVKSGDQLATLAPGQDLARTFGGLRPTKVFHLATHFVGVHQSHDVAPLVAANVEFGCAVAEWAAMSKSVFVNTASAWQRYEGHQSPVSLYAATKQAFSAILDYYQDVAGLHVQEVFLFDTYGPDDSRGKLVERLIQAARTRTAITLGSPGKLINLTHVSDVVDGLLKVSDDREARRDWVIRDPLSRSLADLVAIVGHVSGTPLKVVWDPARDRPREMTSEWIFGTPVTETKRTDLVEGIERLWIATVH